MSFSTNRLCNMEEYQRKVENVFGSLRNEWIVVRSIMLWKEPAYSLIIFIFLNIISSCCIPGLFRCSLWCIAYCVVLVLLLLLSLGDSLMTKLDAAIQIGESSLEEKTRYEEETLSYQRFCYMIAPVLMFVEPHRKGLKKLVDTCLVYFFQTSILISVPMASVLVLLTLTGVIHLLAVSLWIVSLCSLWMALQYYGIHSIIYEMDKQLCNHETTCKGSPSPAFKGAIPLPHTYICSNNLMGQCPQPYNCSMHHLNKTYQWIYLDGGKWWMVNDDDNDCLETSFCTPHITNEILSLTLDRVTFAISKGYSVDFNSMSISGEVYLPIKRLSTKSQADLPGYSVATKWCWYWKNEHGNFVKYQFERELEKRYVKGVTTYDFQVANFHTYRLFFNKNPMFQKNIHFETEREVRRRPCLNKTGHLVEFASFRFWAIMEKKKKEKRVMINDKQGLMRVGLPKWQKEYKDIESLFIESMDETPTIESIERLENQFVWGKYSSTKSHMTSYGASGHGPNERFLFHGTKEESVKGICKKNFDWRMSGTSTGSLYGEGTYFATEASHSHYYTRSDSNGYHYMFVAFVLVGSYTEGKMGLRVPPPMNPNGDPFDSCVDDVENPSMIVIFEKDQCYPAYLVKYRV